MTNESKIGPMINAKTRTEAMSIETACGRMSKKRITIPIFQRDAGQWDLKKESLFIESIINNLTVPGFFFSSVEGDLYEVVDGQQRLTTIRRYRNDEFSICEQDEAVYLTPQSLHYAGKKYSELPKEYQNVFDDYPLTVIYLPEGIDHSAKLEIFRRINEGGTPLTPHDIRMSYYSESKTVLGIRYAGICDDTVASYDESHNPWLRNEGAWSVWKDWWEGKMLSKGQRPSEMFLWYLVQKNKEIVDRLVANPQHLGLTFRGSPEEALDIVCAQLKYDEENPTKKIFGINIDKDFSFFSSSIETLLTQGLPGISVDKYKQISLIIGAASEMNSSFSTLDDEQWTKLSAFIRAPRNAGQTYLPNDGYPEPRGRWSGSKGQKAQCDAVVKILKGILSK